MQTTDRDRERERERDRDRDELKGSGLRTIAPHHKTQDRYKYSYSDQALTLNSQGTFYVHIIRPQSPYPYCHSSSSIICNKTTIHRCVGMSSGVIGGL